MPQQKTSASGAASPAASDVDPLATVGPQNSADIAENTLADGRNDELRQLQLDIAVLRSENVALQSDLAEAKASEARALAERDSLRGDKNKNAGEELVFDPSVPHIVVDRIVVHGAFGTLSREAGAIEKDPHVLRLLKHSGAKLVRKPE